MKNILLDTHAYTHFLAGEKDVLTLLANAKSVSMSVFVLGELAAGFRGGSKTAENMEILEQFLQKPPVSILEATMETAEIFGILKNKLKQAGTPLPINDVWIAAHTLEAGANIITYDQHFAKIPGLRGWLLPGKKIL